MNVLVVGPHPDDQELGMGGAIAKLADEGHDVLLLDMTNGEPTPHGDPQTRAKEAARAAEILGVRRQLLDLPNRFLEYGIEARHLVAGVIRELDNGDTLMKVVVVQTGEEAEYRYTHILDDPKES